MLTPERIIELLKLKPHPVEGGYFRETYRSRGEIPGAALPPEYEHPGPRDFGTAIYYMITGNNFSELHTLPGDEVFHLYLGGPAHMLQLWPNGRTERLVLGTNLERGELPQVVVPAGVWQGTWVEPGVGFALLGATMAPAFDYRDYVRGERGALCARYPGEAERIARLTRI